MNKILANSLQCLIITKNEEANIQRVLDRLTSLEKVVVLDSYSTDRTIEIVQQYPNVELHYRAFDTFANQCNFGLTLLTSEWVLSIDADYVLPEDFIEETKQILSRDDGKSAYFAKFHFLVFGKQLPSNNTTPRAVLFKKVDCYYYDDGHAHRLKYNEPTSFYKTYILHDDRKSLSVWLKNQDSYSIKECIKLTDPLNSDNLSLISKIRKTKILGPFFVFFYCLFVKRLIFSGWVGWHYTLQRTLVETLFSLRLIEEENLSKKN